MQQREEPEALITMNKSLPNRYAITLDFVLFSSVGLPAEATIAGEAARPRVLWSDGPVVFTPEIAASMRYSKRHWEQNVFPIGNGRLGGTIFGDVYVETDIENFSDYL